MLKRNLTVTFTMPGDRKIVLDDSLSIHARIKSSVWSLQSEAQIDVTNLSGRVRTELLAQFTAFNRRKAEQGTKRLDMIGVEVKAGYKSPPSASSVITTDRGTDKTSTVFNGQLAIVQPISGPPDIRTRLVAYTNQLDRASFRTGQAPQGVTLRQYAEWMSKEMELDAPLIDAPDYADQQLPNPATSQVTRLGLLKWLQSLYPMNVFIWIDGRRLVIKDWHALKTDNAIPLNQFVGIPSWNEYGVEFTTLFNADLRLSKPVNIYSELNPSVNSKESDINADAKGEYIVTSLDYNLTSRDTPFYVSAMCFPPSDPQ